MDSIYDPKTQQQIEEFHQRLQSMSAFYRKAVISMSAGRLMRELDMMHEPLRSRPRSYHFWHLVMRTGKWGWRLLDRIAACIKNTSCVPVPTDEYDKTDFGG